MTEVTIKSMRPERIDRANGDRVLAYFSLHIGGIAISDCTLYHRPGTGFFVVPPQGRRQPVTITFLDKSLRRKATVAAQAAYEAMDAEPEDAGLRRVLCAGAGEALERAGL